MAIPQAYLQRPNSAQGADVGLKSANEFGKLALKFAELRARMMGSGGAARSGGGVSKDQAEANVMLTKAQAKAVKDQGVDRRAAAKQTQDNLDAKARRELVSGGNVMGREKHESDMLDALANRTTKVMGTIGGWMPQVDQQNYRDLYEYGRETLGDNVGAFMPEPDKIEGMSPVEWKVAHSKLSGALEKPDVKKARVAAAKELMAERENAAKDEKAAKKEYVRIQGVLDRVKNTGALDAATFAMLPEDMQEKLKNSDRENYIGVLERYAQELQEEYGGQDDIVERYMKKYPGRTREEIMKALNR